MSTVSVTHHKMIIDGQDVDSDEVFELINPATGELCATMAKGNVDHMDQAIESAKRAFESGVWSKKAPEERAAVLLAIAEKMNEEMEDLMEMETMCNGATIRQATGFHVGLAAPHLVHFAEQIAKFEWEYAEGPAVTHPSFGQSYIRKEPVGVCGAIVPWNFPLVLGMWKIAPALACGNSIVVKPDEKTPLSLLKFAQIARDCGLPDGVFNIVSGVGVDVGARLASHPGVDKIAFTGSTAVGREIMKLASGTVKKTSLELGGKGPAVVLDDVDLDHAVDGVLFGCMLYSGQICESSTRLLISEKLHDEFVERMVERCKTITLGDPADFDTDMGPVISARQRDRIVGYLESVEADPDLEFACGGKVAEVEGFEGGFWIEPTIITGGDNTQTVCCEEIFGPVLTVVKYSNLKDAIAKANDTEYGLAASVYTSDREKALDVAAEIRAGTIWINDHHQVNAAAPFGGYKQSGVGRELGIAAFDEYTETKHVWQSLAKDRTEQIFDVLLSTPPEGADV